MRPPTRPLRCRQDRCGAAWSEDEKAGVTSSREPVWGIRKTCSQRGLCRCLLAASRSASPPRRNCTCFLRPAQIGAGVREVRVQHAKRRVLLGDSHAGSCLRGRLLTGVFRGGAHNNNHDLHKSQRQNSCLTCLAPYRSAVQILLRAAQDPRGIDAESLDGRLAAGPAADAATGCVCPARCTVESGYAPRAM